MKAFFATVAVVFVSTVCSGQTYTSYLSGNPMDTVVQPDFGICLMGGAGEMDEAMTWFLQKANGGDVVVIRASGFDGYNDYMYTELGVALNSVETILFNAPSAASDPYVVERINGAEAIWLAGGDQSDYVDYWRGTPVSEAINNLINVRGGAIGGISAGMAVMAQGYFSAQNGTITSEEALENPFHSSMTIGWDDFVHAPFLENAITETHFNDPDRIRYGRIMAFMARLQYNGGLSHVRGLAANEYCAIAIDGNGLAHAFGEYPAYDDDYVYFLRSNCEVDQFPEVMEDGMPLTWNRGYKAVKVYKVPGTVGGENFFDLNDWLSGAGGEWQNWYVIDGELMINEGMAAPDCTDGIAQPRTNTFEIYPNPTTDRMLVEFEGAFSGKWQIMDTSGRRLREGTAVARKMVVIDVSNLPSGIYQLALISDGAPDVTNFVISR